MGGIYFINHKTKDYFPESAGLLILSNDYLKVTMIRNYFLVLTFRTYGRPSGNPQGPTQKLTFLWKNCFSEVIVLVLHICLCFLPEEQIFKSSERGRPRDVYGTQLLDVHGTKWWDVLRTSVGRRSNMPFKSNSQTY